MDYGVRARWKELLWEEAVAARKPSEGGRENAKGLPWATALRILWGKWWTGSHRRSRRS